MVKDLKLTWYCIKTAAISFKKTKKSVAQLQKFIFLIEIKIHFLTFSCFNINIKVTFLARFCTDLKIIAKFISSITSVENGLFSNFYKLFCKGNFSVLTQLFNVNTFCKFTTSKRTLNSFLYLVRLSVLILKKH